MIDPIQRMIDSQLSSSCGNIGEPAPQRHCRKLDSHEDMLIQAIDTKYHLFKYPFSLLMQLRREGYTSRELAEIFGVSHVTIMKRIKSVVQGYQNY